MRVMSSTVHVVTGRWFVLRARSKPILRRIPNGARAVRRLLTALAVALLFITAAAPPGFGASVSMKLPTVKGAKGKEVQVPIALEGADGVGALQLELTYDPSVLEAKSAKQGSLGSGALVTGDAIKGSGPVLVASFDVVGKKGEKSPLTLGNVRAWQGDVDRFDVKISSLGAGALTVTGAGSAFPWWIVILAAVLLAIAVLVARQRRRSESAAAPVPVSVPAVDNVYVDEPQPLQTTNGQQVGTLEPGQWYRVSRQEGEWLEVTDANGATGWVRAESVRR